MRKRIINEGSQLTPSADPGWLDLTRLAQVDLTSEDAQYPIEAALSINALNIKSGSGWQAGQPGEQVIRFVFDEPQRVSRIRLLFKESEQERTQEFVLRWSRDGGKTYREIVRQQYNFSPPGNTNELEDYSVELEDVTALELRIIPNISGGGCRASLAQFGLA